MDRPFKNALSSPPSFDYDPEGWNALQQRLDEGRRRPKGIFLPRWAAALALLLFFSLCSFTSYLTVRLNNVGQRLSFVEGRMNHQTDTIRKVEHRIIKDTVIIYGWPSAAEQSAGNWAGRFPLIQPGAYSFPRSGYSNFYGNNIPNAAPLSGLLSTGEVPDKKAFSEAIRNREENLLPLPSSTHLAATSSSALRGGVLPAVVLQESKGVSWVRRTAHKALQKGQPNGISLSGGGSIANFFSMPGTGFKGYMLGLGAELDYSPHWKLEAGLEYLHLSFTLYDEEDMEAYPAVMPENSADGIQELYATLNYLQLPLGLKYCFNLQGALRPYFKAGLVFRQARRQRFNYEFTGTGGSYYRPLAIQDDGLYLSSLRGGPGIAADLTHNWGVYAEALYHYDFRLGKKDYAFLRYLGFNAGLRFRLY